MDAPQVNLYNLQEPIPQDLGLWLNQGFQLVYGSYPSGWISTSQKAVKSPQKEVKQLASTKPYTLMKLKNKVVYPT